MNMWIQVTFKAETDAIIEQEKVIKRTIEEETKLQHEIKIKGMDFRLDERFLNFEDPPPEIFPAREEPKEDRFSIKQLESLVNEFIVSSTDGMIKNEYFIDLMITKTKNSRQLSDGNGVPQVLKKNDRSDYEMLIKLFDAKLTGYVSLKKLALTFCLMGSPLPTDAEINNYKTILLEKMLEEQGGDYYIGKNTFVKVPAWFDEYEKSEDRPNSHPYPRVKNLKGIIFDVMRNEDYLLNIEEYISLLAFRVPGRENMKKYLVF
jgi:hypothetical protein